MAMKFAPQTAQGARPKSNYALFLGDLSIFCCEKDIEDAFTSYGDIFNVRIQRSKETSRALSYGFIEFSCETAAVTAMNEMNGFVLKGRPLRIRWAAKRNQPVKSENTALHTAATIFVKFASQTGIIVSEALMREHFSVYGEILDATIRTITIDEAYNRSKGYGFVNFINDETQDGLAVAYRAAEELQNATVNGVNYRCEVGHKHQPNGKPASSSSAAAGPVEADAMSVGAYSSSSISLAMSTNSAVRPVFLPAISSPGKQVYYGQQQQHQQYPHPAHVMIPSSASVKSNNSHSSSAPSSPHPAVATSFLPVNPGMQQQYQQQHQPGAMSSNMSVGSGSASGMYPPPYSSTSPHSPHPMSTIVSTISYVPTQNMSSVPNMPSMYSPPQQQQAQQGQTLAGAVQGHYSPAQHQQYMLQQQQYMQQQHQQQYYGHGNAGQYYAQQGMYPQPQQQSPAQQGYYGGAPHDPQYYAEQQYYAQPGYYPAQGHAVPVAPSGGSVGSNHAAARNNSYGNQGQHQGQPAHGRRATGAPQPLNQNYMPHQQQQQQFAQYHQQYGHPQQQQQQQTAADAAQPSSGRRSQRNVSNQSNISEITSATLNDLQGDEEDGDDADQDVAEAELGEEEEEEDGDAEEDEQAAANAAAMISGLRMDSQDDASLLGKSPAERAAAIAAATQQLKATLQVQSTSTARGAPVATGQPINCKLSERRKRNVSGGTNTTEITAQVLFDLQQQEQLLTQEEDESSNPTTPKSHSSSPAKTSSSVKKSSSRSPVRSPRVSHNKGQYSPPPSDAGAPRTRETSAASIAPFTMSSDALDELQKQAELADAASKERRTRRSNSERSTHSDITAALAFMGLDSSSAEPALRALEDEEDALSSAENSLSQSKPVCICGASNRQSTGSPYASSCPFGTSACSCVYKAAY